MKKLVLSILTSIIIFTTSNSQPCLPEGIYFESQEEIDNFSINYPNCTEIEGTVLIGNWEGSQITNLEGLIDITSIGGNLVIEQNHLLTSLSGLEGLTSVGGNIEIKENVNLNNISGLVNINAIEGKFNCVSNNSLANLSGLENITSINGDMVFLGNDFLLNLNELNNLSIVGGWVRIEGNDELISLSGLENLSSIGTALWIHTNHALTDISSLGNLTSIGGNCYINNNTSLIKLLGLQNLVSIDGQLTIYGNSNLTDISALENLSSISGKLQISGNNSLPSLIGLDNINPETIQTLWIYSNLSLSSCAIQSVCELIVNPNTIISIYDNAIGCNSTEEVIEACYENCLPEGILFTSQEEIDSFQYNYPYCYEIVGDVNIHGNDITNLEGLYMITKIGGHLWINNTNLTDLQGLNALETIGGSLYCSYNVNLDYLSGLDALTEIGGNIDVAFSPIYNFTGMPELTSLGGILLYYCGTENFEGLEGLTSIDGHLSIDNCFELENLNGLENITSIDGSLVIFVSGLKSLSGLDNIDPNSIESMHIYLNDSLSECDVWSICQYLASPGGTVNIHNNAIGCNSPEEVIEACLTNVDDIKINSEAFELFPNPTSNWLNIQAENNTSPYNLEIRNLIGQLITEERNIQSSNHTMNITDLKSGVYFYRINVDREVVQQGKLIIKR